MIHPKTKKVCMTMRDIYSNPETRTGLPTIDLRSELLVDEVFGKSSHETIEFLFVGVDHAENGDPWKSIIFDPDSAPLRWSMIPTLMNIAADLKGENGNRFIPVMIDNDDDDITITCVNQRCVDNEYRLTDTSSTWIDLEDDEEEDVNYWFAIIDGDEIYFEKVSISDFRSAANDNINDGYEPLLIQRVVDEDDEGDICYWMIAPKKKSVKVRRHRVRSVKR